MSNTPAPPQGKDGGNFNAPPGVIPNYFNAPPGVIPNYINPVSRGHLVFDSSLALVILAAIFVSVRFIADGAIAHNNIGWHDYTSLVALLWSIARTVGNIIAVKRYGAGRHLWDVGPANGRMILKYVLIDDILYLMGIMFAKLSILLLYHHIFKINQRFKLAVYTMMAFSVAYCGACTLVYLFRCTPPEKVWNDALPGKCIHDSMMMVDKVIGGFNILTDFLILVLPVPMIWGLSMTKSRKLALSAVFGTGLFVLITAIIREVVIIQTLENKDQSWVVAEQIMWLTLELNIGIICGCMPSLPIILRYLLTHDLVSDSTRWFLHRSSQSNFKSTPSKSFMGRHGNSNLRDDSSSNRSLKNNGGPYVDLEGEVSRNVTGKRDEYPLRLYSVSTAEAER